MQNGMIVDAPSCKQYKSYVFYRGQTPAGWAPLGKPAGLLLGPEPVIATPPRVAGPGERLEVEVTAPWSGTWINQDQLIAGQQPWNTLPLVLSKDSECLSEWRKADGWKSMCW